MTAKTQIMLKNVVLAFPSIAEPQAFGEGEPAYGAKFPIKPGSEHQKAIEAAILLVAKEEWKDKAESILEMLIDDGKVAFTKKVYKIWAQDNKWGRRINCSLRGVMLTGEGESFGGGSAPAGADEFAAFAKAKADAADIL
jgi:hypothetical protein